MPLSELIPWRTLTLETSWPPDVVAGELRKRIGERRWLGGTPEPFEGEWKSERIAVFSNSKSTLSRDDFRAVVTLSIEPSHHNGSRLVVKMRLRWFVAVFGVVWMTGALAGSLFGTITAIEERQFPPLFVWVLPLFAVAITGGSFAWSARKTTRILNEMIARAPATPPPVDTGVPFR